MGAVPICPHLLAPKTLARGLKEHIVVTNLMGFDVVEHLGTVRPDPEVCPIGGLVLGYVQFMGALKLPCLDDVFNDLFQRALMVIHSPTPQVKDIGECVIWRA